MVSLPSVSIIIPARNAENTLEKCLTSINKLNYAPDKAEIILINDGSTDGTKKVMQNFITTSKFPSKYLETNSVGAPCARNIGLKDAKGQYVAFTDADCVVENDWLLALIRNFNGNETASVGGPNITPEDDTDFAKSVGAVLTFLSKPGSRYASIPDKPMEIFHNPSCNVIYRKDVIDMLGGFNENMVNCEDEELDYRIRDKGLKIFYVPDAKVYHYRRPTWKRFAKMAYSYAVGRAQAIKLHRQMGKWFHYVPSAVISAALLLLVLSFFDKIFLLLTLLLLLLGGAGIGIMGSLLNFKTGKRRLLVYCTLIAIWFLGYGLGMLRGAFTSR